MDKCSCKADGWLATRRIVNPDCVFHGEAGQAARVGLSVEEYRAQIELSNQVIDEVLAEEKAEMTRYKVTYSLACNLPSQFVVLDAKDDDEAWDHARTFARMKGPSCRVERVESQGGAIKWTSARDSAECDGYARLALLDTVLETGKDGNPVYATGGDTIFVRHGAHIFEAKLVRVGLKED